MHYLGIGLVILAWSLICFWAGMKWGNKEKDKLNAEVIDLRTKLGSKIAGGTHKTYQPNPYKPQG